jgi:hypothetical protein
VDLPICFIASTPVGIDPCLKPAVFEKTRTFLALLGFTGASFGRFSAIFSALTCFLFFWAYEALAAIAKMQTGTIAVKVFFIHR